MPTLTVTTQKLNESMATAVQYGMPFISTDAGESPNLNQADVAKVRYPAGQGLSTAEGRDGSRPDTTRCGEPSSPVRSHCSYGQGVGDGPNVKSIADSDPQSGSRTVEYMVAASARRV